MNVRANHTNRMWLISAVTQQKCALTQASLSKNKLITVIKIKSVAFSGSGPFKALFVKYCAQNGHTGNVFG